MTRYCTAYISRLVMILVWGFLPVSVWAQNLVPNPSFETFTSCPTTFTLGFGPMLCTPWTVPTQGSADYFNACAAGGVVDVPDNAFGSQLANTGDAYVGGYLYIATLTNYREYVQVRLTEPLVDGTSYVVSMYYSLADNSCPIDKLGLHVSDTEIMEPGSTVVLDLAPQIEFGPGLIENTTTWELLSGCYVAHGGEEWIVIGNFYEDSEVQIGGPCPQNLSYIYIDDVLVEEGPPPGDLEFDLGEDATACGEFVIEGPVDQAFYTWQDNTHSHDYTVTETGEYYVTISKGCNVGYDTIMVTILDDIEPVELGDPEQILCPGDQIVYNFDPDNGDYLWQDNSTSSTYVITTSGTYSVTVTNQCGIFEDAVDVTFVDPPSPLDLGPDTTLCPSQTLDLSFDPALGDFLWQDGSTSALFTIMSAGTYALTISNMCGAVSDAIEVDYYPEPIVAFADDTIHLCDGESTVLSFDPEIGDYIWSDGTTGPDLSVSDPGEYGVTVTNPCGSDFTSVYVDYDYTPVVDLGPDVTICPQQLPYTIDLTGLPEAESFFWEDGTTDPDFIIYDAGVYGVTVSNACFEVWDVIEIIVEDASPVVALPGDTSLCPDDVLFLDVGNVQGVVTWQDGTMGPVYGVTTPGTYSVTVSNACGEDSDQIVVGMNPEIPLLDLGPDRDICPGESVLITAGVSGVDYLWQDGSTSDNLVVSDADTIVLTISNVCGQVSDTLVVTENGAAPDAGLPGQIGLCSGEDAMISTSVGGAIYNWSTGDTGPSIIVSAPGLYILTVTNSCGMDVDSTVVIDLGNLPLVNLGPDVSICPGDMVTLDPGVSGSYVWQDGSTNETYAISTPGEIVLTVTNVCGAAADTLQVVLLDAVPVLDLGSDTSICPGEIVVFNPGIMNVNYTWSDGSTSGVFSTGSAGTVILDISNACGVESDTVEVSVLPATPDLNLGVDFSICPGEMTVLSPGYPDVSYLWNDGSTDATYDVNGAGEIILTISNACGSSTDTIVVTEDANGPVLDLGADISVCEGETVTISPGVNGVQYLWQDGSTSSSFITTSSTTVILEVMNGCGSARDTLEVTVSGSAPVADLGPDVLLCDDETIVLTVDSETAEVEWQDGNTTGSYVVSAGGTYAVLLTNTCGVSGDTIIVSHEDSPATFDLGPDQTLCTGETVALLSPSLPAGSTPLWNTGSSEDTITVGGGTYVLLISNVCGSVSDTVAIEEMTEALTQPQPMQSAICPGESVLLDAGQSVTASYAWSSGAESSAIEAFETGVYSVTVTSACEELTAELEVLEGECGSDEVFIPNVFSPNGDGFNDVFRVDLDPQDVTEFRMQIYDRWGEQVYLSERTDFEWDGEFKQSPLQPGVYVYYLRIAREGRRARVLSGDVTLVR